MSLSRYIAPVSRKGILLSHGKMSKYLMSPVRSNLLSVVCLIRYFPPEATQEMLDEWRPFLCLFDMTMLRGMHYIELFLPTLLPEEHHDKGFK